MTTSTAGLDDLLVDEAFFADPYPVYRRLQEEAPVHWCAPWRQWVVTRHADVQRVLKHPEEFSSSGWELRFLAQLPEDARSALPEIHRHYSTAVLSNTDPPAHRRLRTMVVKSFTPRVLRALAPQIEALVGRMLGALGERTDLVADFAYPLPAIVIAQLLGAPEEERERYAGWSADIVDFVGTGRPDAARAHNAERSLAAFRAHLEELIAARRAQPRDDLISLLAGEHDGERLSEDELVSTCITLLFAGHETTANLIAGGVLTLLRHPEQLELVRDDPGLTAGAVEEILRFEGPVQRVRRVATRDLEIGGRQIAAGDLVMAFLGAANRDPEAFAEPDRFDITRDTSHLAFGQGIHFCVGAGLSRIEAPLALDAILAREPALAVPDHEIRWRPNLTFRGLQKLPLEFAR
jgi:cytochrome P450